MTESVSEWTPNPIAEREFAQARRGRLTRRRVGWAFFLSSLLGCPVSCFGLTTWIFEESNVALWFLVPTILALLGFLAGWTSSRARDGEARLDRMRALWNEFGHAGGSLAEITIYQGSAPMGRDQGVVWSEDDRLFFAGLRTSFALVAGDALGSVQVAGTIQGVRSSLTLGLANEVSLGFDALTEEADPAVAQQRLIWEVQRWSYRKGPGGGQGPPLALGPDSPSLQRLLVRALGAGSYWGFGALGVLWATIQVDLPCGFAVAVIVLLLGSFTPEFWAPRLRWRAWRDRRRLMRRDAR